jgi:hypothetical protein
MNAMPLLRAMLVAVATFGVVCPQGVQASQETLIQDRQVIDGGKVRITADGKLVGALVDAGGHGVAKAAVAVIKGRQLLVNTNTDAAGKFYAEGVTPGKILIVTNRTLHSFEAVDDRAAGQDVKQGVIIPVDPETARAAFGTPGVSPGLIGTLLVAGIVGAIIIAADDDDDAS